MTKDKDFKALVRDRMALSGASYTETLQQLQAGAGRTLDLSSTVGPGESPAPTAGPDSPPPEARIFVSGHQGLVGSALMRALKAAGYQNLLTATRAQLDLRDQAAVNYWFRANRPDYVYLVAGTVGGIGANTARPAEFLYDNMMIHATVVHSSHTFKVKKLLYLGSSCIYPRNASQPITEDQLLTGRLEPTNEGYAIAKIAGIKLCEVYRQQYGDNFISAMPTNLYGTHDSFDSTDAHLVPMLMARFHAAKEGSQNEVVVWGSGAPRRELLHVDDLAAACLFLMGTYNEPGFLNVGTGQDLTVAEIAALIRDVVHPTASLTFDTTKPDGMPRKVLDVSKIHGLGWRHQVELEEGLRSTYAWFSKATKIRGIERPARAS